MNEKHWQQVKDLFHAAVQLPAAERRPFLDRAVDRDEALRQEVESLIAAHEREGSFIDSPACEAVAESIEDDKLELKPRQLVGNFEIASFISRGGMGEVYLAQDRRLKRRVALKLLPSAVTEDANRLRRFEQEARAASALNHPNIITIYEIQEVNSTLMIATEFVEGKTLREPLAFGALNLSEALQIAIQIADALTAAHEAGIIHRDIKPENIMIRPDGYVKVLDFGLAKLVEPKSTASFSDGTTQKVKTGSGVVIGTVGYMSPEQARGQTVDARSDIFNLGAVIYEMVTGRKPFAGETPSDVFAAILKNEPEPLAHFSPEAPAELVRIVKKALRKDREERYQVIKDLLLDLRSLKEELDFQAKLDRTVAPPKKVEAVGANIQSELSSTGKPSSETDEIRTAVSTITHSLSVEFKRHKTGALLALTILAITTAAGIIALYKFLNRGPLDTSASPQVLRTTQITFSPGLDGYPSLSPDGKSVAYSSDQSGNFEIYIKQLAVDGAELQITTDGRQNFQPAWSPDGQHLAYYSSGRGGIWIVPALGGMPKQLTEFGCRPAWSPDGSQIAFQSGTPGEVFRALAMPPSAIWIVSSQGGPPRQLTQPGIPTGGHSSPSWSPDGKRIAFEATGYLSANCWTVGVTASDLKKIGPGSDPFYAGDGKHIFFQSRGLSQIELSSSGDPIGKPTTVLGPAPGISIGNPRLSADGKAIVYSVMRVSSNLWTVPLVTASAEAAGPPVVFSPDTSQRNNPSRFSNDGRKIALNRWRPGTSADIWIADADGKNLTQLTHNPATDTQANWFPGDEKLAFLSDREKGHLMLWTITLATGKEEPFLDLGEGVDFAQLSPDAKQVVYNFTRDGALNIWTADINSGQRKQLTFDEQLMGFPTWSPDGKLIAFEMQRGEDAYMMTIPSGGGQPTQLTFGHGKSWPHSWSPDGDKIVFAGKRDDVWNIYWYSLSTKEQKQLTHYSKRNIFARYPAWSPLGNQIVYEYAETTSNIWLMELK